jgi:CubicO group peptidase (beta-lactamase class C family)
MIRIFICAALACAVIAAPASAQPRYLQALEQYLSRAEQLGFNGAVLVAAGDRVLLERGYGWADREAGVPVDSGTAFGLGSVVKQFTAAAILRLQEQGRLRVTDSIGRFLPGVPADKQAITLHHLLTHSSGLPREVDELPRPGVPLPTADEYLRAIMAAPMRARPGAPHHYSNLGFRLLGMVVERASGMPYERYLREQLWAPLGMERTGFALPTFPPSVLAHGYLLNDEGTALNRQLPPGAAGTAAHLGHGGLVSTLGDLFRWTRALDTGRVLADSSRRMLAAPHVPEDSTGASHYGYGWVVLTTPRNTRLVTHNGDDGVFYADVQRYVDEGVTLVFLTNQNDALAQAVLRAVPRLVFGAAVDSLPATAALPATAVLPADQLARYAGEYRLPTGERLRLAHGAGRLEVATTAPGAARHLVPLPPPEGDTAAAMAGERAVSAMVDALLRGDVEAAVRMVAPESSAAEEREFWAGRLPMWERRYGAYQGMETMGTVNAEGGAWFTWILLRFDRGATVVRVRHTGGTAYVQTAPPPLLSAAFALAPAGDGELVVYNAQLRRTLRIQVERDPAGEPRALLIHTPRGAVRAPRVP